MLSAVRNLIPSFGGVKKKRKKVNSAQNIPQKFFKNSVRIRKRVCSVMIEAQKFLQDSTRDLCGEAFFGVVRGPPPELGLRFRTADESPT